MTAGLQMLYGLARIHRAPTGQDLDDPEGRQGVTGVVRPAQHAEDVLDVASLEKLQTAVLGERNLALAELDFQDVAVAGAAEQDRLPSQWHVRLTAPQNLGADVLRLRLELIDRHQPGACPVAADREQVLAV